MTSIQSFPVALGAPVSEMRKAIGAPDEDSRDESLPYMGIQVDKADLKNWRDAVFMRMYSLNKTDIQTVSVNVRGQYRRDTGKIWSLRVMDTWKVYRCVLCGIDNHARLDDQMKALGNPSRVKEESSGLTSYWWLKDDKWLYVCSLSLAPPGIRGWLGGS